jgi:DNA-binding MarR family transcriptional regulator
MTTSTGSAGLRSDERLTVLGLLLETASGLSAGLGRELERRADLPITWFEVLLRLGRTPGERMRMVELARQISFTDSGLSRLADRMEKAGLIGRELDRTDRRGTLAVLTDAGREALDRALPVHLEGLQARVFDRLSDREAATLARLLRKLRED